MKILGYYDTDTTKDIFNSWVFDPCTSITIRVTSIVYSAIVGLICLLYTVMTYNSDIHRTALDIWTGIYTHTVVDDGYFYDPLLIMLKMGIVIFICLAICTIGIALLRVMYVYIAQTKNPLPKGTTLSTLRKDTLRCKLSDLYTDWILSLEVFKHRKYVNDVIETFEKTHGHNPLKGTLLLVHNYLLKDMCIVSSILMASLLIYTYIHTPIVDDMYDKITSVVSNRDDYTEHYGNKEGAMKYLMLALSTRTIGEVNDAIVYDLHKKEFITLSKYKSHIGMPQIQSKTPVATFRKEYREHE